MVKMTYCRTSNHQARQQGPRLLRGGIRPTVETDKDRQNTVND